MTPPKLEIKGVSKAFDEKVVLEDVDLTVNLHDVVCLIGSSGSGKSTLLKCINLLVPVDGGSIVLDGEAITDPAVNPNQVRQRMGIVFQAFNLFPHMKVIDNITLGPRKVHRTTQSEAEDTARRLLEQFGLLDVDRVTALEFDDLEVGDAAARLGNPRPERRLPRAGDQQDRYLQLIELFA